MSIYWGNYNFEGPFLLDTWVAPSKAGVYSIMYKKDPINNPNTYTLVYIGESENLSDRGFPWNHEASDCWIRQAGSESNVYIALYYTPNFTDDQRKEIERELIQQYDPACNQE